MRQFKKLLFVCLAVFGSLTLAAQDIHFSQFYMSPLNLNPALTGVMNCNIRLSGNYRNQWASVLNSNAFNTYTVSYDQRIPVGRNDYFGVGGTFWGDRAGSVAFSTLEGKLSLSYSKKMGGGRYRSHYLVLGAEGGVAQRSIDFLQAQWPSQHDGSGGVNTGLPSGEDNLNFSNFLFGDLGAGLLWFSILDKDNNFYVGAAYSHLNQADVSFFDDNEIEPLFSKFTFHAGGEFMFSDRFGLVPGAFLFLQGPSRQLFLGSNMKFILGTGRTDQAFQAGLYFRIGNHFENANTFDAIIPSIKFDYEDFTIGFSYDWNVSQLNAASNGNGAFEFAMVYKLCGPEKRNVYCPSF